MASHKDLISKDFFFKLTETIERGQWRLQNYCQNLNHRRVAASTVWHGWEQKHLCEYREISGTFAQRSFELPFDECVCGDE